MNKFDELVNSYYSVDLFNRKKVVGNKYHTITFVARDAKIFLTLFYGISGLCKINNVTLYDYWCNTNYNDEVSHYLALPNNRAEFIEILTKTIERAASTFSRMNLYIAINELKAR